MKNMGSPGEDSIVLDASHSILIGHHPTSIGNTQLSKHFFESAKIDESVDSFGFFGSGMNYNTYFPEVKPEDLVPKDEDYIEPVFRMLSECIVSKGYPTDFSQNNVLKDSMNLLLGQTINCDHETDIGNAIGAVKSVEWQESYKIGKIFIPAGINGIFKIDAKANPRIARGILMDPPSVHSNSVTVQFVWDKSHPEMSDDEFWDKMGTYDKGGALVRRVVTKIIAYRETSLVSAGADPWAKKIGKDGKMVLPEFASSLYQFSAEEDIPNHFISIDYKNLKNERIDTIHNTMVFNNAQDKQPKINFTKNEQSMNELEIFLASLFGEGMLTLAEGAEVTQETVLASLKELIGNSDELAQLKIDKAGLEQSLIDTKALYDAEVLKSDPKTISLAELGTRTIASLRSNTLEQYKKLQGDKIDASIIALLGTTDFDTLTSLGKSYENQLEEKFPMSCKACGSQDVNRASSASASNSDGDKGTAPKSTKEALKDLTNKKLGGQTLVEKV